MGSFVDRAAVENGRTVMTNLTIAAFTHRGRVRGVNEDTSFIVREF